jgi:NTE family protein
MDVLRMLDWTFRGGLIKGNRIVERLKDLIGDIKIEDLPISYTAVAVDLMAQREVWFSRGSLFDAIRASIAIPTVFRPHHYEGRILVDGGLLNPVPITPTLRDLTDCTIAIDINAPVEPQAGDGSVVIATDEAAPSSSSPDLLPPPVTEATDAETALTEDKTGDADSAQTYRQKIAGFLDGIKDKRAKKVAETEPGILELFARSLDVVQETITRFKLAAQPPDLVIPIPRNICAFYEFHRAEEVIEFGRMRTREVLRNFQRPRRG